jgi:plastocyanin
MNSIIPETRRRRWPGRKAVLIHWLGLLLAFPQFLAAQAVIEGRVTLPKTRSTPVVNKRYEIVSKGGVVATNPPLAVVYLEGDFPRPVSPRVVTMAQKDLTFVPLLLPIQIGTKVEFPNLDDTYHDVFSYSSPKRFDLGRYLADEKPVPSQTFDVAGVVTLRCDIHEHMRGLILVLATPYFVVTDPEGHFRLEGLPAGKFVLKAWVDSKTTRELPVELKAETVTKVEFP